MRDGMTRLRAQNEKKRFKDTQIAIRVRSALASPNGAK